MTKFDCLYKRTSTGKIQIWYVEINPFEPDAYRTISGQYDGKKVTSEWTRAKPKNVGKANETSGEQQALAEIKAMYEKQVKKGYFYDILEIDNRTGVEPMLATKWSERRWFLEKEGYRFVSLQPKLDGARCIVTKDGCFSRNKEEFFSVPHIREALEPIFVAFPDTILDGELYNHDFKDDFNKIMSLIKKKTPTAEELEESRQKVQYWVYDVPSLNYNFKDRWRTISGMIHTDINSESIVTTFTSHDIPLENVDELCAEYLQQGFEGGMVRLNLPYEFKRSKSLMKWKEFQDDEFEIVDVVDGDGNRSGIAASVICKTKEGKFFGSGPLGSHEYCRDLLLTKENIIGKKGIVVFQNYTPDRIPRFPKFKGVRPDFDM